MTARVEVGVLHAFTQDWNITDGRRQNEMAGPFISGSAKPVKTLRVKKFRSRPDRRTTLAAAVRNSSWKTYGFLDSVDNSTVFHHQDDAGMTGGVFIPKRTVRCLNRLKSIAVISIPSVVCARVKYHVV